MPTDCQRIVNLHLGRSPSPSTHPKGSERPSKMVLDLVMATMAMAVVKTSNGPVILAVHRTAADPPSDADWKKYLIQCKESGCTKVLAYSEGATPSVRQNAMMEDYVYSTWKMRNISPKVAIYQPRSSGLYMIGVNFILPLLNRGRQWAGNFLQLYNSLPPALDHLGLSQNDENDISVSIDFLRTELEAFKASKLFA